MSEMSDPAPPKEDPIPGSQTWMSGGYTCEAKEAYSCGKDRSHCCCRFGCEFIESWDKCGHCKNDAPKVKQNMIPASQLWEMRVKKGHLLRKAMKKVEKVVPEAEVLRFHCCSCLWHGGGEQKSGAVNEPLSLRFSNASLEAGKAYTVGVRVLNPGGRPPDATNYWGISLQELGLPMDLSPNTKNCPTF
eukprot:g5097.t1